MASEDPDIFLACSPAVPANHRLTAQLIGTPGVDVQAPAPLLSTLLRVTYFESMCFGIPVLEFQFWNSGSVCIPYKGRGVILRWARSGLHCMQHPVGEDFRRIVSMREH